MALVTRCPNCSTVFRVTPLHLQAHGGDVRCGHCAHVFNGVATLLTLEEPEIGIPVKTEEEAEKTPESVPEISAKAPSSAQTDFSPPDRGPPAEQSGTSSSPGIEISRSEVIQDRATPEPARPEVPKSEVRAPGSPVKEKHAFKAAKTADKAGDKTRDRRAAAKEKVPQTGDAKYPGLENDALDNYLPEGYPSDRLQPLQATFGWAVANLFLLVVLVAQVIYFYRAELAVNLPGARPLLEQYCKVLQCTVSLSPQTKLGDMESPEMTADKPPSVRLAALVRNRARYPQAFPPFQLALIDTEEHVAVPANRYRS